MINIKCKECEIIFQVYPSVLKRRGRGQFCSKICFDKNQSDEIAGYSSVHIWLRKIYGKANRCECSLIGLECRNVTNMFDWALLKDKGYTKDRESFVQLCRSCHHRYDTEGEINPFFGKKHSQETRLKMRRAWKRRKKLTN